MTDYAVDNGPGMSQVNHGNKVLLDLPNDATSPSVRANGKIFFVGELLQCTSGAYFIPEHFFQRTMKSEEGMEEVLYSLGRDVLSSDTGFVVKEEHTIAPISIFNQTYLDIVEDSDDFQCRFAGTCEADVHSFELIFALFRVLEVICCRHATPILCQSW